MEGVLAEDSSDDELDDEKREALTKLISPFRLKPNAAAAILQLASTQLNLQIESPTAAVLPIPPMPTIGEEVNLGPIDHQQRVRHNRQTLLEDVWTYPLHAYLEYPPTSSTGKVGHLFTIDPNDWTSPIEAVAYSLGHPKGGSRQESMEEPPQSLLLVNEMGQPVPCVRCHLTCEPPWSAVRMSMVANLVKVRGSRFVRMLRTLPRPSLTLEPPVRRSPVALRPTSRTKKDLPLAPSLSELLLSTIQSFLWAVASSVTR